MQKHVYPFYFRFKPRVSPRRGRGGPRRSCLRREPPPPRTWQRRCQTRGGGRGVGWGRRPSPDNFRTTATYIYIFLFWGDLFLFLFPLARLAYRSPETRVCRGRVQNGSPCPEKRMIDIPEIQAVHVPSRGRPRGSWHRAAAPPPPPLGAETRTGNPGKFRQHDRGGAGHAVRNLSGCKT